MRSFFGKTIMRGNAVTDADRILRQVAWKEGEPFSEEKIADTQKNLARDRRLPLDRGRARSRSTRTTRSTTSTSHLSEARRISLLYGVGYQYANGASHRNDPFADARRVLPQPLRPDAVGLVRGPVRADLAARLRRGQLSRALPLQHRRAR